MAVYFDGTRDSDLHSWIGSLGRAFVEKDLEYSEDMKVEKALQSLSQDVQDCVVALASKLALRLTWRIIKVILVTISSESKFPLY